MTRFNGLSGRRFRVVFSMVLTILCACRIKRFRVVGDSMEPMLLDGQIVWASVWAYKYNQPKLGDVIVFRDPGQPSKVLIKEVVGKPGDDVYVDSDHRGGPRSWHLIEGQYFVAGRNSHNSRDSRDFGPITSHLLIGKVWC